LKQEVFEEQSDHSMLSNSKNSNQEVEKEFKEEE
jgi:hypothetical protein